MSKILCPASLSHDTRERHRSAKANTATGAVIHLSNTTLAKARFLDSRVQVQIKQRSSRPYYNAESPRPKGPLDSVCAHAGDGKAYLAQGSSMQQDRRITLSVHVRQS